MRRINKYLWLIASAAFCSCQSYDADDHKFGNVVYLDVAETTDVQTATIKNTLDELDRTFSATLAYPSGGDVTVSIAVDPSLVDTYNARHNTSWPMLDAKYYSLSDERVTIPAGKTASDAVTLHLQELLGEGEDQTGALTLDATYLLPVTITNASVPTLTVLRPSGMLSNGRRTSLRQRSLPTTGSISRHSTRIRSRRWPSTT